MDIYERLKVKKFINAYGTVTREGGSLVDSEVVKVMIEAGKYYVNIDELLDKAGQEIASMIGVEAAFITSGAAAGMAIATAACMAGEDRVKIEQLPDTAGMKNEVIALRCHRVPYDQAVLQAGARFVEVGTVKHSSPQQIQNAISNNTVAIFYLTESLKIRGSLPLDEVIEIAHNNNIPVIVNAAAELPPPENLGKFVNMGADLVIFSGGKEIRGPQNSGLILGRKELITACAANSNPNYSIGRPMKVSKEVIAGLVKAVELYTRRNYAADRKKWESQVKYFIERLSSLSGINAYRNFGDDQPWIQPACIPRVYIDLDATAPVTNDELVRQLREGEPGIVVGKSKNGIVLNPQTLREGEKEQILRRLEEILEQRL